MTGRCAGCGLTDRNADKVREHTRYCLSYRALYAECADCALDPEQEFRRYVAVERALARQDRKEAGVAEADRRRAESADRWETPPDPLSED